MAPEPIAFDSKTNRIFTMTQERGPGATAHMLEERQRAARHSCTRFVYDSDDRQVTQAGGSQAKKARIRGLCKASEHKP